VDESLPLGIPIRAGAIDQLAASIYMRLECGHGIAQFVDRINVLFTSTRWLRYRLFKQRGDILREVQMWQERRVVSDVNSRVGFEGRRGDRATIKEPATKKPDDLIQLALGLKVLREQVGGVHLAVDLQESKLLPPEPLLHPKRNGIRGA
jgi:hypothetical protein